MKRIFSLAIVAALFAGGALAAEDLKIKELAALPKPVTSFGAAVADGALYVFGGHLGSPHEYSADMQGRDLLRLDLTKPAKWEVAATEPRRTGVAMVAYAGKLYRIGGWEAKNAAGDKWELYSTPDFARFDAKSGQWQELAPLPQGRSSHDAAVLGSQLYVVGGWQLKGKESSEWHESAFVCDLAAPKLEWKEIAKPPFNRRALAVAAYNGKVYVIGGMDDSNDTTTGTDIYDPQSNAWSKGPALPGKGPEGFGTSAFGTAAGLFATTASGGVYQLSADGQQWNEIAQLKHPRNFHRLVPADDHTLLVVGGTSRGTKVTEVELVQVAKAAAR